MFNNKMNQFISRKSKTTKLHLLGICSAFKIIAHSQRQCDITLSISSKPSTIVTTWIRLLISLLRLYFSEKILTVKCDMRNTTQLT